MKQMVSLLILALVLNLSALDFTVYNSDNSGLPFNKVYSITIDHAGDIWFGGQKSGDGFAYTSRLAADMTTWTVFNKDDLNLFGTDGRVFFISEDTQNGLWFCTHYGITVMRANGDKEQIAFTSGQYDRSVLTDPDGKVYISIRNSSDRTLSRIYVSEDFGANWSEWQLSDIGFTLDMNAARPEFYDIYKDSQGNTWFCTYFGITCRKADGSWQLLSETEGKYSYAMTIDNRDHIWMANQTDMEVWDIAPDGSIVKYGSSEIPALVFTVNDIEADAQGNIWCATLGGGLIKIMPDGSYEQISVTSTSGVFPEGNRLDSGSSPE